MAEEPSAKRARVEEKKAALVEEKKDVLVEEKKNEALVDEKATDSVLYPPSKSTNFVLYSIPDKVRVHINSWILERESEHIRTYIAMWTDPLPVVRCIDESVENIHHFVGSCLMKTATYTPSDLKLTHILDLSNTQNTIIKSVNVYDDSSKQLNMDWLQSIATYCRSGSLTRIIKQIIINDQELPYQFMADNITTYLMGWYAMVQQKIMTHLKKKPFFETSEGINGFAKRLV
jgi:hypothetical protein